MSIHTDSSVFKFMHQHNLGSLATDEVMNTYTGRRRHPQARHDIAGQRCDDVYPHARRGVVPVDLPFPSKPVLHRQPPRTQDSHDLCDLKKITISAQPRGPLMTQEHHSNDIRETAGKDSHRLPSGELQMARAIHARELMLQEKLWKVEEKIRQKFERDGADTTAGDDQESGEERHNRGYPEGRKAETKTGISEYGFRERVRSRDMLMQERRCEDFNQSRKKQDQKSLERRNTHKVSEAPQSKGIGSKGINESPLNKEEVSGELNKSRWQNVKERTRKTQGAEKNNGIWVETVKMKYSEQKKASTGSTVWASEKKYKERTNKESDSSVDKRDTVLKSQVKASQRLATDKHRGAGRNQCSGSPLPLASSSSHGSPPQQGEDSTDVSLQLFPCEICNRKFIRERLEKHVQVCKRVKQSHRQVFNAYANRTKGTACEEFLKTHTRSETPEVLKKRKTKRKPLGKYK